MAWPKCDPNYSVKEVITRTSRQYRMVVNWVGVVHEGWRYCCGVGIMGILSAS